MVRVAQCIKLKYMHAYFMYIHTINFISLNMHYSPIAYIPYTYVVSMYSVHTYICIHTYAYIHMHT